MLAAWLNSNCRSRAWLAEQAETTEATLSRIINGLQRPSPELAERLGDVTGIHPWELIRPRPSAVQADTRQAA